MKVELEAREDIDTLQPDMHELLNCDSDGLLAVAPGGDASGFDFVSRCFFPKFGVDEVQSMFSSGLCNRLNSKSRPPLRLEFVFQSVVCSFSVRQC